MNKIQFSLKGLKKGVDLANDSVSPTLGAAGKNMFYRSFYSKNTVGTNDGYTILNLIHVADEETQMGVDFIKQASSRTNSEAGDGTTTTAILAKYMADKGLELVQPEWYEFWKTPVNAMILKREINDAVHKVVDMLSVISTNIVSDEDMFKIANISVENPDIARIVVEAVKKAGENGIVLVEESQGMEIEKEEIEGMEFDEGYITPYMATNPATMEAVLEDVPVLITDKTISLNNDLVFMYDELKKKGIDKCLVICGDMNGEILATTINARMDGTFHAIVVKKPGDNEVLQDIAAITGATALTSDKHIGYFNADVLPMLGRVKKVIVNGKKTTLIGGCGKKEDIQARVDNIKAQVEESTGYKQQMLKERLAKLVGGVVIIKVGAPTEADMKYLKMKIDDSVASTRAALEEGTVIGGGSTLYELSLAKPTTNGERVVYHACSQPIRQIMKNAGFNPSYELKSYKTGDVWNALTCGWESDPFSVGLIDPAKVERCALENAANFAGLFLTGFGTFVDIGKKE